MNKTDIKKNKGILKKYRSDILGFTAFFAAFFFIFWIGSLGFYW